MNKFMIVGGAVLLVAMLAPAAMADQSATQTVDFVVREIQQIVVNDPSVDLIIEEAVAGQDPTPVTADSSYSITVNSNNDRKITGQLDSEMPDRVTLEVALGAPPVGGSTGSQELKTKPVDLVTGMSKTKGASLRMTYTLSAEAEAGEVSGSCKVTYTITN